MHWLALQWLQPDAAAAEAPSPKALAWWALGFTPHVAWVEEALLLEVSSCERLWGGRRVLLQRIWQSNPAPDLAQQAQAATSLAALARLRLQATGHAPPAAVDGLPLHTLSAARPHLGVLARLGCRNWGQIDALPRAGLARRFGPALGHALDVAFGRAPDAYAWAVPPERFAQSLELPERADSAPALLWSARRLLTSLQHWLAARQHGVLALELAWTFDQRRLDGQVLPPLQAIELRTAEPVQRLEHIQRLLAERLARTPLLAPARAIRLRTLETAPWQATTRSFLPEEQPRGDPLHVFAERVGARLGADRVRVPVLQADHRPECRQRWQPWSSSSGGSEGQSRRDDAATADVLAPTWLLREPLPLELGAGGQPCHHGPLRLLAGPHRIEAGWWPDPAAPDTVARDYYIAQNPAAELLWVYRERATTAQQGGTGARWFLQGVYA